MAKYRIKIVEKNNGEKFYIPQSRRRFSWYPLYEKTVYLWDNKLTRIDLSYSKDYKEKYSKIEEAQDLIEKYKCQLENDLKEKHNNKTKSVKHKYL